jgi:hypothetical protein
MKMLTLAHVLFAISGCLLLRIAYVICAAMSSSFIPLPLPPPNTHKRLDGFVSFSHSQSTLKIAHPSHCFGPADLAGRTTGVDIARSSFSCTAFHDHALTTLTLLPHTRAFTFDGQMYDSANPMHPLTRAIALTVDENHEYVREAVKSPGNTAVVVHSGGYNSNVLEIVNYYYAQQISHVYLLSSDPRYHVLLHEFVTARYVTFSPSLVHAVLQSELFDELYLESSDSQVVVSKYVERNVASPWELPAKLNEVVLSGPAGESDRCSYSLSIFKSVAGADDESDGGGGGDDDGGGSSRHATHGNSYLATYSQRSMYGEGGEMLHRHLPCRGGESAHVDELLVIDFVEGFEGEAVESEYVKARNVFNRFNFRDNAKK